ncbi:histidine kinase [Actinomycetospora cinnamomea]|uniref:DNA ligase (ATP) n=1 Tax=Actinomycetospora cinnamomea TaxID=663609 RepID=A0A2U1FB76_9PSEU|nr:histidine kinase [Actinomycetospora cinnamomea]PVZ09443.1 ATP-dependent DNA ligase [Actinomycetospora cinnamomea]
MARLATLTDTAPPDAASTEASPHRPMIASSGDVPRGAGWAFEFLWDGLRCLARTEPDGLRLVTEAGRDVTSHFPELGVLAPWTSTSGLVLDGVVVALDGVGRPSAGKLRRRHRVAHPSEVLQAQVPVSYYVFDVLEVAGASTRRLPYRQRRELLAELDLSGSRVVIPPCFTGVDAEAVISTARRYGLDGVVAKRLESTYQAGRRSRSWIETPVRRTQEVVVGGWLPARGRPDTVGALLVGVPGESGLRYSGRVVTGITAGARRELDGLLATLERADSPFDATLPEDASGAARWLAPRLVGQVEHRRWTATGLLERPTWQGLRPSHPATVAAPVLAAPVVDTDLELDELETTDGPEAPGAPIRRAGTDVTGRRSDAPLDPSIVAAPSPADVESALRSRFSAHFVHNTLTAIASYVRTDPGRARELLTEFADFTRYSFRSGGEMTTVGDELHNAERYLTLEQARFGARLRAEVAVAPEVRGVLVPPFVVAPLVENAVRHGIEPVPGGGAVSVFAAGSGSDCVITVSDDGAGMGPEATRAASQVDQRHGGIAEVSRRMRAAFGSQCDVHVDTRPGVGTAVRLRLPAVTAAPPDHVMVG